jgi:hypothetical protein
MGLKFGKMFFVGILILWSSFSTARADPSGRIAGTWVGIRLGFFPQNLLVAGVDQTVGGDLFICRALYKGALHPGRTTFIIPFCLISVGNEVVMKQKSEGLKDDSLFYWIPVQGDQLPSNVVKTGFANSGEAFYSCRFFHETGLMVGKVVREKVDEKDTFLCQIVVNTAVVKNGVFEVLGQDE